MSRRVGASATDRMRSRLTGRGSLTVPHQPETNTPDRPWEDPSVRDDVKRNFMLALSEPGYYKLRYISRHLNCSMQEAILRHVYAGFEKDIAEIQRQLKTAKRSKARAKSKRA